MCSAVPCRPTPDPGLQCLADAIRAQHRGLLTDLRLEESDDGLVLLGRASSFYGKQIALHEVRRRSGRSVVANRISVG